MSKIDFIRTPDGSQLIVDYNLEARNFFKIPTFAGSPTFNGNDPVDGAIGYQVGVGMVLYSAGSWNHVAAGGDFVPYDHPANDINIRDKQFKTQSSAAGVDYTAGVQAGSFFASTTYSGVVKQGTLQSDEIQLLNQNTSKYFKISLGNIGADALLESNVNIKFSGVSVQVDSVPSNANDVIRLSDLSGYEPTITSGTSSQYWRGDKTFQTLNTTAVTEGTRLYYTDARVQTYGDARYVQLTTLNVANGYAGLDSGALLPISLFPDAVLGNVKYKGTYNGTIVTSADTALNGNAIPTAGTANIGYYFISTGSFTLNSESYEVGDWAISNGAAGYKKIDNSDAVTTVFGRLGNIVANVSDYSAFYGLLTNPLSQFASTTSAQLRSILSDETGTGAAYFQGGDIGTPSAGVATNFTGTASGLSIGGNAATVTNGVYTTTFNTLGIANQTSQQTSANFNIDGTGIIATALLTPAIYGGSSSSNTLTLKAYSGASLSLVFNPLTLNYTGTSSIGGAIYQSNVAVTNPTSGGAGIGFQSFNSFQSTATAGGIQYGFVNSNSIGATNSVNISGQQGYYAAMNITAGATGTLSARNSFISQTSNASAMNITTVLGFSMSNTTNTGGGIITNQHGVFIAQLTSGTNNTHILTGSGSTGNWNIYNGTTYNNYLGTTATLINTTTDDGVNKLQVNGGIVGTTFSNSITQSVELITNTADRDFSGANNWTGTNWNTTAGVFQHTTGSTVAATLTNANLTNSSIIIGRQYYITITGSNRTAGILTVALGGTAVQIIASTTPNGIVSVIVTAGANNADLTFNPGSTYDGSIDNISVKSVINSNNIDNDGALYINSNANILKSIGVSGSPIANLLNIQRSTVGKGTISVTASGTTVTGTGTDFANYFNAGDVIYANGEARTITVVNGTTQTLTTDAWTSTFSGSYGTTVGNSLTYSSSGRLTLTGSNVNGQMLSVTNTINNGIINSLGISSNVTYTNTTQGLNATLNPFISSLTIGATNNQNLTNTAQAQSNYYGVVTITSGATGTFTRFGNYYSTFANNASGVTISDAYISRSNSFGNSGTITNFTGYNTPALSGGTITNQVDFLAGALNATGNWAFYNATSKNNFLGTANTQIGSTTATAGAEKLQVTGTASISSTLLVGGAITSPLFSSSAANNANVLTASTATTGWQNIVIANTSGYTFIGQEGSVAGTNATGSLAYSSIIGSGVNKAFHLVANDIVGATLLGSGFFGIGYTADPTSGNKFAVNSNSYFNGTITGTGAIRSVASGGYLDTTSQIVSSISSNSSLTSVTSALAIYNFGTGYIAKMTFSDALIDNAYIAYQPSATAASNKLRLWVGNANTSANGLTIDGNGDGFFSNYLNTGAPASDAFSNHVAPWKFGGTTPTAYSPTGTFAAIDINGTIYYLSLYH